MYVYLHNGSASVNMKNYIKLVTMHKCMYNIYIHLLSIFVPVCVVVFIAYTEVLHLTRGINQILSRNTKIIAVTRTCIYKSRVDNIKKIPDKD